MTSTGRLLIDVSGEYQVDILPDPEFHLLITLRPVVDATASSTGTPTPRSTSGIVGSLLSIVAIVAGTLILGPGVGMTLFLMLLAADLIVDAVASAARRGSCRRPRRCVVPGRAAPPGSPGRSGAGIRCTRRGTRSAALLDRFDVTDLGLAFDGVAVLDKEAGADHPRGHPRRSSGTATVW